MSKKLSVALCTYNGAKYLPEQLESIAAQTRLPDELIVGDDCSSDDTVSIIQRFAQRAPFPVHLTVNESNLGSSKNFELAINRCASDIIALSDQDDVWMPEKLAKSADAFERHSGLGLVFSNAELVDEQLRPLGKNLWDFTFPEQDRELIKRGKTLEVLVKYNVVTGATMAFRSHFRRLFIPIPNGATLFHDRWIALLIATQAEVRYLDETLIKYRQHHQQQVGVPIVLSEGLPTLVSQSSARQADTLARPASRKIYRYQESIYLLLKDLEGIAAAKKAVEMKRVSLLAQDSSANEIDAFAFDLNKLAWALESSERNFHGLIKHYQARDSLPASKVDRLGLILRELKTGRYHQHSKGYLSALKDLLA